MYGYETFDSCVCGSKLEGFFNVYEDSLSQGSRIVPRQ